MMKNVQSLILVCDRNSINLLTLPDISDRLIGLSLLINNVILPCSKTLGKAIAETSKCDRT